MIVNLNTFEKVYNGLRRAGTALLGAPCRFCGEPPDTPLEACLACRSQLPWLVTPCRACGEPLATAAAALCGRCLRHPPPWDRLIAAFTYTEPVAGLIRAFKTQGDLAAGRLLADLLAERLMMDASSPQPVLLATPLQPKRLRERGFNQAVEIAQRLPGHQAPRALRRVGGGPHQRGQDAAARRRNVRDAFAIAPGTRLPDRVAVVDDVVTTGATAGAITRLLRHHGAREIVIYALAKTPSRHA